MDSESKSRGTTPCKGGGSPRPGAFAEIQKITLCSPAPGAGEPNPRNSPRTCGPAGRTTPAPGSTKGRARPDAPPRAGVAGAEDGGRGKKPKLTPCSRMQPLFSAFPHTKACAPVDRLGGGLPVLIAERSDAAPASVDPNRPLAAPAARPQGEPPHVRDANATPGPVFSFTLWRGSHGPSEGGHVYKVCAASRWVAPVPPRFRLR